MLSMFKDKKGFSVLFRDANQGVAAPPPPHSVGSDPSARCSRRVSATPVRRTGGSGVAQLQCQRCSKRFSALAESDSDEENQTCCRRCGYPTCPQCREAIAGTPPWVCCVCDGPKSFMWLLEKTKMGPRLVSKIVEFCDPRGQRLMRSMFRFTLQQYRAVSSPRPSPAITAAGRVSGSRAGSGGVSTSSRPTGASPTPPAASSATSKSRTTGRISGERGTGSTGLCAVSATHCNVHRPSPYSHPKHASLLRSVGRVVATEGKENSQAAAVESPKRPHGSEVLRRDDAVGVVEYSPGPSYQIVKDGDTQTEDKDGNSGEHTPPQRLPVSDLCTAVQDIYRASDSVITPRSTLTNAPKTDDLTPSPHVRPSGHSAFQREALHQLPPNNNNNAVDSVTIVARDTVAATLAVDTVSMPITPPGQLCCLGRSFSRVSSGSDRSDSPAPRFPSFVQFLDDQAAVAAGQTHLPRDSAVFVTVSPDSTESGQEDDRSSAVFELGVARGSRPTVKSNTCVLHTPRGTQPSTPPSAIGVDGSSSSRRDDGRTSGLSGDYTPTRALDLSDARGTVHCGSSGSRRTTRGSLLEMHAPHLYGGSSGGGSGTGRCSRQIGDSPFMYDLPSQFSSNGGGNVASARGQVRRQRAPLATRTAGRPLGGGVGDVRGHLARQTSRTTPLQRTASRNDALQRVPSCSRSVVHANSSTTGQFTRKNSATAFGRLHSGTAQPTRTPSSRKRLAGVPLSPNGWPLQRTESNKLVRTASATLHSPILAAMEVPTPLERTHSHYGLAAGAPASTASPLKRTASHSGLGSGGGSPSTFRRFHSTSAFARSATVTAGFTRSQSANVFWRGAAAVGVSKGSSSFAKNGDAVPHPHSTFARTATGTCLSRGVGGGAVNRGRRADGVTMARTNIAGICGRLAGPARVTYATARKKTPGGRPVSTASLLQPSKTSTHSGAALVTPHISIRNVGVAGGVRPPSPTGFSRVVTNPRTFERQPSYLIRHQQQLQQQHTSLCDTAAGRARVDPAPALVGVGRRKAAAGSAGLRRTPSTMSRCDSATLATPRTPRPYIVASVSTANTPAAAAVSATAIHSAARPVLSSGACSPKVRSTRDSLTSGSAGTTRTSGGGNVSGNGALSPVSNTPVVKAPSRMALAGRTSAPRRRPGAAGNTTTTANAAGTSGGGGRTGVSACLGTGTRCSTPSGSGGAAARTRTGSARPPSSFVRLNSRPLA